jgi:ATP-dependent RNA helicase SUPV3L1/SUV3
MIEVWRPAPAHPRRQQRKPRSEAGSRRHARGGDGEGGRSRQDGDGKGRPHRGDRRGERSDQDGPRHEKRRFGGEPRNDRPPPRPRERPIDPDSPFAKLQSLKKELEKSGRE